MEHNLQTIAMVSIEELKAAIENLRGKETYTTLEPADVAYLVANVYRDRLSAAEHQTIVRVMIALENRIKYEVIDRLGDNPYRLKKYIEAASLYVEQNVYADYWRKVRNILYRMLVELYGHDLYSIGKVPVDEVRYQIQKLKKLSRRQLCEWVAVNFPERKHLPHELCFLDVLDLWYIVNHQQEIPQEEYDWLKQYVRENFYDLFVHTVVGECDYENEYQVRKWYFFTLSCEEEMNARVYRCILNEDFAAGIPEDDSCEAYLNRMR